MRIIKILQRTTLSDYVLVFKIYYLLHLSKWYIENRHLKEIVKWIKLNKGVKKRPLTGSEKRFSSKLAYYTRTISKFVFFKSKCYDRALTVKKILNEKGIPSSLLMGLKVKENDEMKAHAWVECGNWIVVGGLVTATYKPLQKIF